MKVHESEKYRLNGKLKAKAFTFSCFLIFFFGCFESEIQKNAAPAPSLYKVSNGAWIGATVTATNAFSTGGFFASSSGDSLFSFPQSPAIDGIHGFLYVPDPANNEIVKLDLTTGEFVGALGNVISNWGNCPSVGVPPTWCYGGLFRGSMGDGAFSRPGSIALDLQRNFFYVSDNQNYRVTKYDLLTGAFVGAMGALNGTTGTCPSSGVSTTWCTGGRFITSSADGGFADKNSIVLDAMHGTFYVVDTANNRIESFVLISGAFVGAIGAVSGSTGTCPSSGVTTGWCTGGIFTTGTTDGALNSPAGIAIDVSTATLYIADSLNHRIETFSLNTGAFIGAIGKVTGSSGSCPPSGVTTGWCTGGNFASGSVDGAFNNPKALAIDTSSRRLLLVADTGNHRVQKFNLDTGAFVGSIGYAEGASTGSCPSGSASSVWCTGGSFSSGSLDGMMKSPSGLVVDLTNNVLYVGDSGNGRLLKYNLTTGAYGGANGGRLTATKSWSKATVKVRPAVKVAAGGGDGLLSYPQDVAIDFSNGSLLVADSNNNRIQNFSLLRGVFSGAIGLTSTSVGTCPSGAAASTWCTGGTFISGAGDGMLSRPSSIKVDWANGFFYVSDSGNHRINKYNLSNGAFVGAIGRVTSSTGTCISSGATTGWCTGGAFAPGAGDGMLNNPKGIEVDLPNGFLFVADNGNARVAKFNLATGAFLGAVGKVSATSGSCPASGATLGWCTGGTFTAGEGDGMLNNPIGVTLDASNGALYIVDNGNNRVQKFSELTGLFVGAVGNVTSTTGTCPLSGSTAVWCTGGTFASGTGDGMFSGPTHASVDLRSGFLYVSDAGNNRITQYNLMTGAFVGALGFVSTSSGTCVANTAQTAWCTGGVFTKGTNDLMFNNPSGMAIDPSNKYLYVADPNNGRVNVITP
ncbi:MAG: NHL repeat-containing protein [Bdellovibrionia bacterium]